MIRATVFKLTELTHNAALMNAALGNVLGKLTRHRTDSFF